MVDEVDDALAAHNRHRIDLEGLLKSPLGFSTVSRQQQLSGTLAAYENSLQELTDCLQRNGLHTNRRWIARKEKAYADHRILECECRKVMARNRIRAEESANRSRLFGQNGVRDRKHQDEEALLGMEGIKIDESIRMVEETLAQGRASLFNLMNQEKRLAGVRSKLLSAAQSVGVSASTILSIEKRLKADGMITYVGIFVVSLTLYVFFCWWTKIHVFWWFPSRLVMAPVRLARAITQRGA